MAYSRSTDFEDYQSRVPGEVLGADLDLEFVNIATEFGAVGVRIDTVVDAGGGLTPGVVDWSALAADVQYRIDNGPLAVADQLTFSQIHPASVATTAEAQAAIATSRLMTPALTRTTVETLLPYASQAAAEAGTDDVGVMSPLRVADSIGSARPYASQAAAEAGTDADGVMSPLRVAEAVRARRPREISTVENVSWGVLTPGAMESQTFSVASAVGGDSVTIGYPFAGPGPNIDMQAWVSNAGVVTLRAMNTGTVDRTPTAGTYRLFVNGQAV